MPDGLPVIVRQSELAAEAEGLRLGLPTEKQRRFVLEFMVPTDGELNATQAAVRVGCPPETANRTASRWLRNSAVKAAIAAKQAELAERNAYTQAKCSADLDDAMAFAKSTENASAYVRAVELKGRMHGHIVDRTDVRLAAIGGFFLNVIGLAPEAANG